MKRVVFTAEADDDLDRAVAFVESRRTGYGDRLRDRVAAAAVRLAAQPGIGWRVGRRAGRRMLVTGFQYSLVYVVEPSVVRVVAIPHHRQSSRSWLRRLP